eukprot:1152495-Pelagomonas_calceolata.AAC.2
MSRLNRIADLLFAHMHVPTRFCAYAYSCAQLVCDGVEVPVPMDAEGLIITNINCHMVRILV